MSILKKIFKFYYEGFKNMPLWGKQLWLIILLKGFLVFVLIKFVFFPNYLKKNYSSDEQRSEHVINELIKTAKNDTIILKH